MKKSAWHISGPLNVTGQSRFIGEEPAPADLLYAKIYYSPVAHANLKKIKTSRAEEMPGVKLVVTRRDIPGKNSLGHFIDDEPLFPEQEIMYLGQPLAVIVAESEELAEQALQGIELDFEELSPLFGIQEAEAEKSWLGEEREFRKGDPEKAFPESDYVLEGEVSSSTQEHFYFETQRTIAIPGEGKEMTVYSSTQSTMEVQSAVARVLGTSVNNILVDVKRLGGAFGGKESRATLIACLTALAAKRCNRPVELKLKRSEDFRFTGKRHPFTSRYRVGFDKSGIINAYDVQLIANGGAYTDLSLAVLSRAMYHAEHCYAIPNIRIRGKVARTNLPPNTAFRGFGGPQGIFVIESVIERIAHRIDKDPLDIRRINFYNTGDVTPYGQMIEEIDIDSLVEKLKEKTNYDELKRKRDIFNAQNKTKKMGLSLLPLKFGVSFTTPLLNQASSLIWIYTDGTVSVTTCAVEMGQEVSTKIALIVADELGISINKIRIESSNTQRVANASPTAASTGSDLNGNAALTAARELKKRLVELAAEVLSERNKTSSNAEAIIFTDGKVYDKNNPRYKISFPELIREAYDRRIPLGAYGYYKTPDISYDKNKEQGRPFFYYVYGAALVSLEIDLMSGENKLLQVYILHQNGKSLHYEIDKGQTIGAFMQSYGWCTMEEMPIDDKGNYLASTVSTYKIPTIRDLPEEFNVELVASNCKQASVLGSKAIGEPPFIYGEAAFFAIQDALQSLTQEPVQLRFPATPESVLLALSAIATKNEPNNRAGSGKKSLLDSSIISSVEPL